MDAQILYLPQLLPKLPQELAAQVEAFCLNSSSAEPFLENFLRFVVGGEPTPNSSDVDWQEKQAIARGTILSLVGPQHTQSDGKKRAFDEADTNGETKRPRLSPPNGSDLPPSNDLPVFTLHSVSTTSPVRKKADVTIGKSTMTFKHATSGNLEATIPLTSLRRAFLLPTRGKSKPHWTVVILSTDTTEKDKSNTQIIFGLDATTTAPLTTTSFTEGTEPTRNTIAKGCTSLPVLRAFLSHLPGVQLCEPTTDDFKSACNGHGASASSAGIPGIEAYRAAKPGNLWFMKQGVLWGENKPCEFWSVEDLINSVEGVRISPGSGRVFSLTLTRKVESEGADGEDDDMGEGPEGIETELGMIDSREREVVAEWVRKHQNLFGRKAGQAPASAEELKKEKQKLAPQITGPLTINQLAAESDSEDDDFADDSGDEDSGGSGASDSEDEGGSEKQGGDEEEAEGTDEEEDGEGSGDEDEVEELDPKNHPLLRPGAVPKLSKAAINMVVGMMEDDLMGGDDAPEEEDQLEDD